MKGAQTMNTLEAPITWVGHGRPVDEEAVEACFGLGCLLRGSCRCYRAVELVAGGSTTRASCLRDGKYPTYVAVTPERFDLDCIVAMQDVDPEHYPLVDED
jgi:hypothetical protein